VSGIISVPTVTTDGNCHISPAELSMDVEVASYNNFPLLQILIYMNQQRHCLICFPTLWLYSNHDLRAL